MTPRRALANAAFALAGLAVLAPSAAFGHARMNPAVSLANQLQLYSLAVPTEQNRAFTTKVVLTLPANFSIDSFVPSPGWQRTLQQSGSGNQAVIQKVTWTGGHVPTGEDSLFQFLAQPGNPGTYRFEVQQTYSNGQIVEWNGPESAAAPAPSITVAAPGASSGGGGSTSLEILAVILAAVAVLLGCVALAGGRGRPLA